MSTTTISQKTNNAKRNTVVAIMLFGSFIAILNQTLLSTALPAIMNDLQITAVQGQWLTTAFMLTNGIMIPATAYLMNKFTTRHLFMGSMGIFALGTIAGAFSGSFSMLLIARVTQALGAGIIMPLLQTVFLYVFPIEKRGSAMGMLGIVMAFAPAIGPSVSGWIVDTFSWNALFYIIAPIAVLDIIFAAVFLTNVGEKGNPKLDVPSLIFSSFGFGGILYGFSAAGSYGWIHPLTLLPLLVGIVCLVLFTVRQLHLPEPLLELKVFKSRAFTYSTILAMILYASMIAGGIIMPIYLQTVRGYSALASGLVLMPGSILMGIMSPITGMLFDRFGPRHISIIGLGLMTGGTVCFAFLSTQTTLTYITLVYTVRMFGIALLMMPISTWGLNSLPTKLLGHGTAVSNTLRQVSGSIGTAILITVMSVTTANSTSLGIENATIHGINVTFSCAAGLSLAAFILAVFTVKNTKYNH